MPNSFLSKFQRDKTPTQQQHPQPPPLTQQRSFGGTTIRSTGAAIGNSNNHQIGHGGQNPSGVPQQ